MAATIKNGLYGTVTGKIGNLVFCIRNGKTYVRSTPKKKKSRKISDKQKSVQSRFKTTQRLVSNILPFIRIGFKNVQPDKTAINSAMSYNLREAFIFDEHVPGYRILWNKISFSRGMPNAAEDINLELITNKLTITWKIITSKIDHHDLYSFKCCVLIIPENYEREHIQGCINENSLSTGIQSLQVDLLEDAKYHVYIGFFSNDGSGRVMDSEWVGWVKGGL